MNAERLEASGLSAIQRAAIAAAAGVDATLCDELTATGLECVLESERQRQSLARLDANWNDPAERWKHE